MAIPNERLISLLRITARKLEENSQYQWGHMGACNCGFLAQEITNLSKAQLHSYAMEKYGDWTEQSMDYCPTSGYPIDHVISSMLEVGLNIQDFRHLEKLTEKNVLSLLPKNEHLIYNNKEHVIIYMKAWADFLEIQLLKQKSNLGKKIKQETLIEVEV